MIMAQLKNLYCSMMQIGECRTVFPVTVFRKNFSCIFLTDTKPFRLYVTALGLQRFSMEFLVSNEFCINSFLEHDVYLSLFRYLDFEFDPKNPFSPLAFLKELDRKIPAAPGRRPEYNEVVRISAGKKTENPDKPFFLRWQPNSKKNVTPENLEQTERAFGFQYRSISKKYNISSCWTDDETKAHPERINDILSR